MKTLDLWNFNPEFSLVSNYCPHFLVLFTVLLVSKMLNVLINCEHTVSTFSLTELLLTDFSHSLKVRNNSCSRKLFNVFLKPSLKNKHKTFKFTKNRTKVRLLKTYKLELCLREAVFYIQIHMLSIWIICLLRCYTNVVHNSWNKEDWTWMIKLSLAVYYTTVRQLRRKMPDRYYLGVGTSIL